MKQINCLLAQINPIVGAIEHNAQQIIDCCVNTEQQQIDLIVFPELILTGYPPEDLLYRDELYHRVHHAIEQLCQQRWPYTVIVGHPIKQDDKLYNVASVIQNGEVICQYQKQHLPNYNVFDEKRYFTAGDQPGLFTINNTRLAITICEDLWWPGPAEQARDHGAQAIISINASPFHRRQAALRVAMLQKTAKQVRLPIAYVNMVGGQDELVFDGGSMLIQANGKLLEHAPFFKTALLSGLIGESRDTQNEANTTDNDLELIYQALCLGLKDYMTKNGFKSALLGLSGGIDSALTLAIAADAIGASNVEAVSMPSEYTADMSNDDAAEQCRQLGVKYRSIAIPPIIASFNHQLADSFTDCNTDVTEENLQARIRGVLLMALSNKFGNLVLSTGNKSELAVGFSTLYGDMCGGFSVLKDVPKTLVYELANYRNQQSPAIPQRVIDRPPSAELSPDQLDQDRLPPYDVLDAIIEYFVESDLSANDIIEKGFAADTVHEVITLIKRNEYKRSQAPIGTRITQRAFGKDRRYPITHRLF